MTKDKMCTGLQLGEAKTAKELTIWVCHTH